VHNRVRIKSFNEVLNRNAHGISLRFNRGAPSAAAK
jgi:hypothetical protein